MNLEQFFKQTNNTFAIGENCGLPKNNNEQTCFSKRKPGGRMQRFGIYTATLLYFVFASLSLSVANSAKLNSGLKLYMSFDRGYEPAYATGDATVTCSAPQFVAGKSGKAIQLDRITLDITARKNLEPDRGSISMWICCNSDLKTAKETFTIASPTEHIKLNFEPKNERLLFMTGKTIPQSGFKWHYTKTQALNEWGAGEWHHIAITWDIASGKKYMY
ncbi:MAG TPA: hypothetical protein DC049_15965, partial [Spirochaetia bacterium]|nr:hypothetical protein [Spirochaetia bacterium]